MGETEREHGEEERKERNRERALMCRKKGMRDGRNYIVWLVFLIMTDRDVDQR